MSLNDVPIISKQGTDNNKKKKLYKGTIIKIIKYNEDIDAIKENIVENERERFRFFLPFYLMEDFF